MGCECPGQCDQSGAETILTWPSLISIFSEGEWVNVSTQGTGHHMLPRPAPPVTLFPSGLDHFLYGLSDELKQAHREQLFAVHREGLIDVSNK